MKKDFTKKDLQTGDVIMLRNRELGVVFAEKEAIMYQNIGTDFFDAFNEDLTDAEADESAPYSELDIMEVRRSWNDSVVSFLDPEDSKCVYRRKDSVGYVEKRKRDEKKKREEKPAAGSLAAAQAAKKTAAVAQAAKASAANKPAAATNKPAAAAKTGAAAAHVNPVKHPDSITILSQAFYARNRSTTTRKATTARQTSK